MLLEYLNTSFRYGQGPAVLNGVSFAVAAGTTTAIIGPSGSGKTTLLRLAAGLEEPTSGAIRLDLESIGDDAAVAYVSQHLDLWPHLPVIQNVTLALRLGFRWKTRAANGHALDILKRLGIKDLANRYSADLSGGQRQRVAIARAIAVRPRLLLLDEITAALDPETADDVLSSLIRMKPSDQTILLVTHHLGFAARFADDVVFLDDGAVVETIRGDHLLKTPVTARLQQFVDHY
jgi:polar amino acid transport system ATP-binding protein